MQDVETATILTFPKRSVEKDFPIEIELAHLCQDLMAFAAVLREWKAAIEHSLLALHDTRVDTPPELTVSDERDTAATN